MRIDVLPDYLLAALYGWLDRASAGRLARTGRLLRDAGMSCAPLDDVDLSVRPTTRADLWALLERFPYTRVRSLRLVRGCRDGPGPGGIARPTRRRCVLLCPLDRLLRGPRFGALRRLALSVELAGGSGGAARVLSACPSLRSVELHTEGRVGAEVWRALAALRPSAVEVRVTQTARRRADVPCGPAEAIARGADTLVLRSHEVPVDALFHAAYPTPTHDCASRLRVLAARISMPERPAGCVPSMPALQVLHLHGGRADGPTLLRWLADGCPRLSHLGLVMDEMLVKAGGPEPGGDLVRGVWQRVVPRLDSFALAERKPTVQHERPPPAPRLRRLLLCAYGVFPRWTEEYPLEELLLLGGGVTAYTTELAERLRGVAWPALRHLTVSAYDARCQVDASPIRQVATAVHETLPRCDVHLSVRSARRIPNNVPVYVHAGGCVPYIPPFESPEQHEVRDGAPLCACSFGRPADFVMHLLRSYLDDAR